MRRTSASVLFGLIAGCAGAPIANSFAGNSTIPAPDAFTCVRDQVKALDWIQDSYDKDDFRVTAHKYDWNARRPDVQFRRLVHRLSFDVDPGSGDALTTIHAQAATYAEYTTQRGPTEVQERTAEEAKQAAQAVIRRCSEAPAPGPAAPAAPGPAGPGPQ